MAGKPQHKASRSSGTLLQYFKAGGTATQQGGNSDKQGRSTSTPDDQGKDAIIALESDKEDEGTDKTLDKPSLDNGNDSQKGETDEDQVEGTKKRVKTEGPSKGKRKTPRTGARIATVFSESEMADIMDDSKRDGLVGELAFAAFLWRYPIVADGSRTTINEMADWWKKEEPERYTTLYPSGHSAFFSGHARLLSSMQKGDFGDVRVEETADNAQHGGAEFWYGLIDHDYDPMSPFKRTPPVIFHFCYGAHSNLDKDRDTKRVANATSQMDLSLENNRKVLASHLGLQDVTFKKSVIHTIWFDSGLRAAEYEDSLSGIGDFQPYACDPSEVAHPRNQDALASYKSLELFLDWIQEGTNENTTVLFYLPEARACPIGLNSLKNVFMDDDCVVGAKAWFAYPRCRKARQTDLSFGERWLDDVVFFKVQSLKLWQDGASIEEMTHAGVPGDEAIALRCFEGLQKGRGKKAISATALRLAADCGKWILPLDGGKHLDEIPSAAVRPIAQRVISSIPNPNKGPKKTAGKGRPAKAKAVTTKSGPVIQIDTSTPDVNSDSD